ncbi:glycogen synthase [Pseudohaliea rubra]|uniref:starch synthase n=1 Tax=Pseudohaliea rubra DSM 19751 TaxID=1265313 RepID=A0A095VNG4_9GAMM|nr:glycogen/starch synthase [Pseudohaliea rubra]KGE02623.1 Glycogen synthase, ADP-glucose transglucosylase [Pseudohaliea rubra DSM 19751]
MHILMLAAEDGALPGGKVGGMGDVLRDIPPALAALGHRVTVLTPGYGRLSRLPGAREVGMMAVPFGGRSERLGLFELPARGPGGAVRQLLLEHPAFAGPVYCNDPPERPFATDASKFALFCAGAVRGLLEGELPMPDVVHLHDWHMGTFALLSQAQPRLAGLRRVCTIHNLAMQGIRPLRADSSSLGAWFPGLVPLPAAIDPRYPDCYNPLRAAIGLCEALHTVSPTYAREICDPASGLGEGLQRDLAVARDAGRLHGILNGCDYPGQPPALLPHAAFFALAGREVERWLAADAVTRAAHVLALRRIDERRAAPAAPARLLTIVGRLTAQKVGMLAAGLEDGRPVLDHLLEQLRDDELLVVLGSGDAGLERFFNEAQARSDRLLFLCGYSEALSEQLYRAGELFLMPSSFEPCGIAQLLAMRAGQPCLVHHTGGLADTVRDGVNGFAFAGETEAERLRQLLARFRDALRLLRNHPRKRDALREAARAVRFPWADAARAYVERLYH